MNNIMQEPWSGSILELANTSDAVRYLNILMSVLVLSAILIAYIKRRNEVTFIRKILWLGCASLVFSVGYGTSEVLWWPHLENRVFFALFGLVILLIGFIREQKHPPNSGSTPRTA